MKNLIKLSLITSTVLFFVACGGGGGSTEQINDNGGNEGGDKALHVKGKVVDGYVKNATVFFDKDFNFIQSADEPSAITDEQGNFSIPFKDIKEIPTGSAFVVKKGGTDVDTNKEIKQVFSFSTPHGVNVEKLTKENIFITPVSTLLHNIGLAIFKGEITDLKMTDFQSKVLGTLKLDVKELKKDPLAQSDFSLYATNLAIQKAVEITGAEYKDFAKIFKANSKDLVDAIKKSNLQNKEKAANIAKIIQDQAPNINANNRVQIAKHIEEQIANFSGDKDPHKEPGQKPEQKPQEQQKPDVPDLQGDIEKGVLTGRVVDGYLKGATVFHDKNRNFKLDKGEKSTTTDEYGRFKLELGKKPTGMGLLFVAINGEDQDTKTKQTRPLSFSPGADKLTSGIYITPASSIIAHSAFAVLKGELPGLGMMNFETKMLEAMGLTKAQVAQNPLKNPKAYKINQSIQKSIEIAGVSYDDFIKILPNQKGIKSALDNSQLNNKKHAINLVDFYDSLTDSDIKNNRAKIAKSVQKSIADKTYKFSKE